MPMVKKVNLQLPGRKPSASGGGMKPAPEGCFRDWTEAPPFTAGRTSQVSLPVSIFREGGCFVAYSPALDLSTSAMSYEKVRERFGEAVQIFFEEILDKGTVDEVLTELGWQKVRRRWEPPVLVSQESEKFIVPLKV
ncbi:hypothetical protein L6258_03970 [Candidatus Parcubacteria bacterium]|nr:hypothetical protein [Candidatus Parcubacteria bacterium]